MSSCNLRIKSNYIQVHLPMLTARNNGFKGSPLSKNVSKIIQERKKFRKSRETSTEMDSLYERSAGSKRTCFEEISLLCFLKKIKNFYFGMGVCRKIT